MNRLLLCIITLVTLTSFSQTSGISGKILDKEFNLEPLPFANVLLKNTTKGTTTNFEGEYELINVEPGTYTVVVSYVGYETIEVDVEVESGKTTILDLQLSSGSQMLEQVVIRTERRTNTTASVIESVKNARAVVSAISAEQMQKSNDANAAEVIQRVPGVTIIDGKFVMIRGLSERYNNVRINGALAPSTEVEKRTFSFDLIPTNALDKMEITKSGAA